MFPSLASPPDMIAVVIAVAWPLVAGLAVVLWSKRRAATRARRLAAVDAELKALYGAVEQREPPERLTMVLDALEEAEALKAKPAKKAPARA